MTRDIKDYVAEAKAKKDKETKEVTEKLEKARGELDILETKVKTLCDELFAIETVSVERCKAIIEELKPMSKTRVALSMDVYKAEYRLKQLKYL